MSEISDSKRQSTAEKRKASPQSECTSPPAKETRVGEGCGDVAPEPLGLKNGDAAHRIERNETGQQEPQGGDLKTAVTTSVGDAHPSTSKNSGASLCTSSSTQSQTSEETAESLVAGRGSASLKGPPPSAPHEQSDWAAMAAAEALASLTRAGGDQEEKEKAHSSKQAEFKKKHVKKPGKRDSHLNRNVEDRPISGKGQHTQAAAADSSTSSPEGADMDSSNRSRVEITDRQEDDEEEDDDEDDSFLSGTSSTPSSSSASDNDNGEDTECAIVSVKMAPEMRQSVALLAQVQLRLEALEKKAARLHQRLDLKLSQKRQPHLEQRNAIIQAIPGFWMTAFLNHPHLSVHIDENDEDALSYMTNLEVESFKSNKFGFRIGFHFSRNNYFQNSIIVKEFHLGRGGSAVSFSNPILWHRGQNLTSNSGLLKGPGSLRTIRSFFSWFSDHSNPSRDEIAEILKDDLHRNPLRYYLTPLWEPRENGSGGPGAANNRGGNECVVISDSDEEEGEGGPEPSREEEDEDDDDNNDDDDDDDDDDDEDEQDSGESSEEEQEVVIDSSGDSEDGEPREEESPDGDNGGEDEELDVEDLGESQDSESQEAEEKEEGKDEEEDIEVGREDDG